MKKKLNNKSMYIQYVCVVFLVNIHQASELDIIEFPILLLFIVKNEAVIYIIYLYMMI